MSVPRALFLRAEEVLEGGWTLLYGPPGAAMRRVQLSASAVAAAQAVWEATPATVVLALAPLRLSRWERAVGGALTALLRQEPDLWAALASLWLVPGEALLLVQAASPATRQAPWELLTPGPDEPCVLEDHPELHVARLGAGTGELASGLLSGICLSSWSPSPSDPACDAALAAREEQRRRFGLSSTPAPGLATLLACVSHGVRDEDWIVLLGPEGGLPPESLLRATGGLAGVQLLVWETCLASAAVGLHWNNPAGAALRWGVPAVLAPCTPVSVRTMNALWEGLLEGLSQGEGLLRALSRGRARVSAINGVGVGERPWVFQLHLAAAPQGIPLHILPLDLPTTPAPALLPLLAAALPFAQRHGFLGLEHLAEALHAGAGRGVLAERVRSVLAGFDSTQELNKLVVSSESVSRLPVTPRLARLLLAPDEPSFWEAVCADPGPLRPLERLRLTGMSSTVGEQMPRELELGTLLPPRALELMGGPEDGRVLVPDPSLGRWRSQGPQRSTQVLYVGTRARDERLSSQTLIWSEAGVVTLLAPGRLKRGGTLYQAPVGPVHVAVGDQLLLGAATTLRVIP